MPKQVRIMSGYILTGKKEALMGKYLTLEKIYLKEELKNLILEKCEVEVENILEAERILDKNLYIFYVKKGSKGEFIGKNGSNIKKLKKIYKNIIVREI